MTRYDGAAAERASLLDAIDHLLSRGVVLAGETTLSIAGVDLVYLGLNVVLASVERLEGGRPLPPPAADPPPPHPLAQCWGRGWGCGPGTSRIAPIPPRPV